MPTTRGFYEWFLTEGLDGLGGWFIFLIVALAAVVWLLYDSQKRRLPVTGWRMAVVLLAALLLPAAINRLSESLRDYQEAIFYLGLLGGVLPPVLAIGYYVTFQGMVGCPQGHVYEAALGRCPFDEQLQPEKEYLPAPPPSPPAPPPPPPRPVKPKAQAWLVGDGHNYQLNLVETTIGRSSQNDIQITGDPTVSKVHAKIVEQNGHFRLIDLGSRNGTRVNNRPVRQPMTLYHNDEIRFGDNTVLRFVTGQR